MYSEMESLGKTPTIHSYGRNERGHIKREHNQVAFNIGIAGMDYILLEPSEYDFLNTDRRYFEITADDKPINLYLDYDNKKPSVSNPLLSYSDISEHIDYMTTHIRLHNIAKNPKFYVLISIETNNRHIKHDINERWIKSLHIISNIALQTKQYMRHLATELHTGERQMNNYFDCSIYNKSRLFRAVFQSKGAVIKGDKPRTDIFIPFTSDGKTCYEYKGEKFLGTEKTIHDLSCYIISNTDNSEFANYQPLGKVESNWGITGGEAPCVEPNTEEGITGGFAPRVEYKLTSSKKLEEWIKKKQKYPALSGKEWYRRVHTFLGILKLLDISQEKRNSLIENFLDIKRGKNPQTNKDYTTQECKNNDRTIIENICKNSLSTIKNSDNELFIEPSVKEMQFIYSQLGLSNTDKTIWKVILIDKIQHLHLHRGYTPVSPRLAQPLGKVDCDNSCVSGAFYNMKTKVLIKNGTIMTERKRDIGGEIMVNASGKPIMIKVLRKDNAEDEVSYNIHEIMQRIPKIITEEDKELTDLHNVSINNIEKWTEIEANNNNEYNCGAVGSRKTSLRMDADITYTLNQPLERLNQTGAYGGVTPVPNTKLLMIRDSVVMCNKTYQECCEKYGENIVYHYNIKSTYNDIHEKRIFITTIHSLYTKIHKLQTEEENGFKLTNFTHVFIDEIKNVFAKFNDIKPEHKNNTYNFFEELLKKCIVKYYDADKDIYTIKQIEMFGGLRKPLRINNLINYKQTNHIIEVKSEKNGLTEIISLLKRGYKITISCSYNLTAKKLHTTIHEYTGKHGAILCGNGDSKGSLHEVKGVTGDDFKTDMSGKTNDEWSDYDYVIWTSTITTGISYDKQEIFYKHFSLEGNEGENAIQTAQMIFRTRNLISKTICIIPIRNNFSLLNEDNAYDTTDITDHNNSEHAKQNFNIYAKDKEDYKKQHNPNFQPKWVHSKKKTHKQRKAENLEQLDQITNAIDVKMSIINTHIQDESRIMKMRIVLEKCILWGCDTMISNTYEKRRITEDEAHCDEAMNENINARSWLEMDRTEWLRLDYISKDTLDEYAEKNELTERERKEKGKYYELIRYGYSHTIYSKYAENDKLCKLYDEYITKMDNNAVDMQNTYSKAKYLMLYKVKKYYDFIYTTAFTNTENTKGINFLQCRKQSYYFYVVFNVFEMFNITYENIAEFLEDSDKEFHIVKNEENYKKLVELYERVKPVIEYLKANDKSGDKITAKTNNITDFKKITILLEKPMSYFGLKLEMGRGQPRTKRDKTINISLNGKKVDNTFIQHSFRVQAKAYRYNSNETDDIVRLSTFKKVEPNDETNDYEEGDNGGDSPVDYDDNDIRPKIRLCNYNLWKDTHIKFCNFITNPDNYKNFFTEIEAEIRIGEIDNDTYNIDDDSEGTDDNEDLFAGYDY